MIPTYADMLAESFMHVPLNENGASTVAENRTGVDGTYTNMVPSSATVPGLAPGSPSAIDFNGTNQYIDIDGINTSATDLTFSCWVKSTQTGTSKYLLDFSSTRLIFAFLGSSSGKLGLHSGGAWSAFGDTPNDGERHHIAFVISGTTATCYADAVQSGASATITAVDVSSATQIAIGAFHGGSSGFYDGTLDEAILLPRAVSSDEIAVLYAGAQNTNAMRSHQQLLVPSGN